MDNEQARAWFTAAIARGRAAQPSPATFPLEATLVAEAEVPAEAREARDFYRDACGDCGGAWVHRQHVGGDDVLFVHVGTDGDEGWLEIFDATGGFLLAAFVDGTEVHWETRSAARARALAAFGADPG